MSRTCLLSGVHFGLAPGRAWKRDEIRGGRKYPGSLKMSSVIAFLNCPVLLYCTTKGELERRAVAGNFLKDKGWRGGEELRVEIEFDDECENSARER